MKKLKAEVKLEWEVKKIGEIKEIKEIYSVFSLEAEALGGKIASLTP